MRDALSTSFRYAISRCMFPTFTPLASTAMPLSLFGHLCILLMCLQIGKCRNALIPRAALPPVNPSADCPYPCRGTIAPYCSVCRLPLSFQGHHCLVLIRLQIALVILRPPWPPINPSAGLESQLSGALHSRARWCRGFVSGFLPSAQAQVLASIQARAAKSTSPKDTSFLEYSGFSLGRNAVSGPGQNFVQPRDGK